MTADAFIEILKSGKFAQDMDSLAGELGEMMAGDEDVEMRG
jgi:hypothetical protein